MSKIKQHGAANTDALPETDSLARSAEKSAVRTSGIGRLTGDAVTGISIVVESVHKTVFRLPGLSKEPDGPDTKGLTGLAYKNIRTMAAVLGDGIDVLIEQFSTGSLSNGSSASQSRALAVLNGVLGDYLEEKSNPLAISMCFRRDGLALDDEVLADLLNKAQGKIALMVHGSCMNDLQWQRNDHDHGAALSRDLGYEAIYLYYNSGLHISENGRELSCLLEKLTRLSGQPLDIVIVAHSMGGLVARSACHYSKELSHTWLTYLRKMIFLGTPHHGAHLEKAGNLVDVILDTNRYSAPFSRLGKIRSSGVTDLRFGNVVDEDWQGRDRFKLSGDKRIPIKLPKGVACYAIAATTGKTSNLLSDSLVGDGLVSVSSALGHHRRTEYSLPIPIEQQWIGRNMGHLSLLDHPDVYAKIKNWLAV